MTGPITLTQTLNADAFYRERDARGELEHPLSALPPQRIAIVAPPPSGASAIGLETALFWTASIIRRMGRAFSDLILVTTDEFRRSDSRITGKPGMTIEQFLSDELRMADPFGRIEWRDSSDTVELSDAAWTLWLGSLPIGAQPPRMLAVNAHGWVAEIRESVATDLSLSPPDFDAAPAAIAMSACLASARIFAASFSLQQRPGQIAFALDSGRATTDPVVCARWLADGTAQAPGSPWKAGTEGVPNLSRLLVVSAGGIGGNLSQILRSSYFHIGSAYVVDPDSFEISNLNRAIGVGVSAIGTSKAILAANALGGCTDNVTAVQASYESWMQPDLAEQFRLPSAAVAIGVDQVRTRLTVASDWPSMLLNAATSGSTFSSSIHLRTKGGCIGCWYGQDDAAYLATRTPLACAAGAAPGTIAFTQVASYPFVSVAAAAQLAAMLVQAAHWGNGFEDQAGSIVSMSLRSPECAQRRRIPINDRCLLLCGQAYVQSVLQRKDEERRPC
jgi:ThiF family